LQFLIDNFVWVALAITSGTMLLWPYLMRRASCPSVSTLEATQLLNYKDANVLDVRAEAEFRAGHLTAARHLPLADLATRMKEIERLKKRPLIVFAANDRDAGAACRSLRAQGFEQVFNLAGGVRAWREAGLPLVTD